MAKRKTATAAQLVDWRIGHHIEAAGTMIADALNRVAVEMAHANTLRAEEIALRREHLLAVLESKTVADKAAQRLLGMVPDFMPFHDLRPPKGRDLHDLRDAADASERGPEWVKDVLADTEKSS
jgi:hypothetical protein